MTAGIGSNTNIGLLASISRGGGSVSGVVSGRGAASLIQNSVNNLNLINEDRERRKEAGGGFGRINAGNALFGNFNNNLFNSLQLISLARVEQSLRSSAPSSSQDREQLVSRLSKLSLDRLAVLKNALSDNPEVDVPRRLERSVDAMSDRDRTTFKLAVNDAIDNVKARQEKSNTNVSA